MKQTDCLGGQDLRDMFAAATSWLEKSAPDIDLLNVFPVPDGDCGTNMLLTMRSCVEEAYRAPDSDEFRYMVKHPGPSPDFSDWCVDMQIKWIGVDAVSADHPMNTIMRIWHPKTFEEANRKLIDDFGQDWDEMYPLDKYYQDMHLNLFPKRIVHAENLGRDIATAESGRYYIGCYVQKAMEAESMWGRFVAFKESGES